MLEPGPKTPSEVTTAAAESKPVAERAAKDPWDQFVPRIPIPKETFEAKYAGVGLQELERIREELQSKWFLTKEAALDERMTLGQFERRTMVVGQGPDPSSGEPGFTLNAAKGGPEIRLSSHAEEPGVVRVTWLPFDEYPDLYDLADESRWVARRCMKLGSKD